MGRLWAANADEPMLNLCPPKGVPFLSYGLPLSGEWGINPFPRFRAAAFVKGLDHVCGN